MIISLSSTKHQINCVNIINNTFIFKKTIVKIRSETRKKIYKTIKRCYKNYEENNFMYFYSVMNNYCYSFKYDKQNKLKERIESVYKS